MKYKIPFLLGTLLACTLAALAQSNSPGTNGIQTYINPIQPGEHPDQTMIRVGNDYYSTGSSFHFTPYVAIVHSTDMMHWETIARVVPPNWSGLNSDAPAGGIWEGALAQFGGYFWVYFSNNAGGGQYFCKATNMTGPWSAPTRVTGSTVTGYDNSIFVDDDGTPYMLMKNGQSVNRIQQIDKTTGQVTGTLMNMDWINANNRYSWAEGPVMCKRNGRYYYFMAGDVSGGQYSMSSATLTATESAWTLHGAFFSTATSPGGFTGPNHMTQPVQAPDGTWWTMSHAYDNSGWYGQGRLGLLHQVTFDANGVPHGAPPSTNPVLGPNLPSSNISYNFPKSDYFLTSTLKLDWHFFNKANATKYSLTAAPGYIRLAPGTGTCHVLQKEGGHYYSMVTKVNLNATANGNQAGLRIMNGNDDLFATLYTGYNGGKKIGFAYNGVSTEVNNAVGNVVWLKIERTNHSISGYYSADGLAWTQVGGAIDISNLDKFSTTYNEWVGTSIGLYATNITADFDLFMYRDGFAPIKVMGHQNHYGVTSSSKTPGTVITNSTSGDWLMLAGVNMGQDGLMSTGIEVNAASTGTASLEVWIDNIGGTGTQIATVSITSTGGTDTWKTITTTLNASGQHDVYLRWVGGANSFYVYTIRFVPGTGTSCATTAPAVTSPVNYGVGATASPLTATGTSLKWYTLATGGTASTTAPTPSTTTVGSTTYYVTQTANGCESPRASIVVNVVNYLAVPQACVAPAIDGKLTDIIWASSSADKQSLANVIVGTVSNSADLSGTFQAAWDATNLYVMGNITDNIQINGNCTALYNDDAIELFFDIGNTKAASYGANDFQYTFRWSNPSTMAGNIVTGGNNASTSTTGINYAFSGGSVTGLGYTFEASIPWSLLGGIPAVGQLLGFDFQVDDADATGCTRKNKMSWVATTDDAYVNPAGFGTAKLATIPSSCTVTALEDANESHANQILCYPNPFSGQFTLQCLGTFSYSVSDMVGNVLEKGTGTDVTTTGSQLVTGMYMLKIQQGSTSKVIKISKE